MNLDGVNFLGVLAPRGCGKWKFIEFQESYIALEGLNGSGKSTLLRGIESIVEREINYKGYDGYTRPGLVISLDWDEFARRSMSEDPIFGNFWETFIGQYDPHKLTVEIAREELMKFWRGAISNTLDKYHAKASAEYESKFKEKLPHGFDEDEIEVEGIDRLRNYYNSIIDSTEEMVKILGSNLEFIIFPDKDWNSETWQVSMLHRQNSPLNSCFNSLFAYIDWPNENSFDEASIGEFSYPTLEICKFITDQETWIITTKLWLEFFNDELALTSFNPDTLKLDDVRELTEHWLTYLIELHLTNLDEVAIGEIDNQTAYENFKFSDSFTFEEFRLLDNEGFLDKTITDWADLVSNKVSSLAKRFIDNLPQIVLQINPHQYWPTMGIIQWKTLENSSLMEGNLRDLSETQQRWVKLAIFLTCLKPRSRNFIFIDEPEKGLHLSTVNRIHSALLELSENNLIVVSSHSPIFLKAPQVVLVEKSDSGIRNFSNLVGPVEQELNRLGISALEYSSTRNLLVITEGAHDKAILEGLIPEIIRDYRLHIVSGEGIYGMPSFFNSSLLPYLVNLPTVFIVDGINNKNLNEEISRIKTLKLITYADIYKEVSKNSDLWLISGKGKSKDRLQQLITLVILNSGKIEVNIIGTSAADCIEWLPPSEFGLNVKKWITIWNDYKKQNFGTRDELSGKQYKNYLDRRLKSIHGNSYNLNTDLIYDISTRLFLAGTIPPMVQELRNLLISFAKNK